MPNQPVHMFSGAICGGLAASLAAREQYPVQWAFETVGGVIAGRLSGTWPDRLDPPFCPSHRALGHAVAPAFLATTYALKNSEILRNELRAQAYECSLRAADPMVLPLERICYACLSLVCSMLAGATSGILAGYWSHIALDSCTPCGVPIWGVNKLAHS